MYDQCFKIVKKNDGVISKTISDSFTSINDAIRAIKEIAEDMIYIEEFDGLQTISKCHFGFGTGSIIPEHIVKICPNAIFVRIERKKYVCNKKKRSIITYEII